MRKRTRKHRGTAGKMVGGFLAFFCLILLTAGMFWAIQGYVSYQKAVKEKPLAQAVEEIRSEAQWVPLKQVPELYKKAVLAVEDHRYYTHHGIDWISMARAVVHDIRVMKPEQGGSTITQQLVKNMYYDQNKTLARKAAEAWTALYVERQLSKEEILELYINTYLFRGWLLRTQRSIAWLFRKRAAGSDRQRSHSPRRNPECTVRLRTVAPRGSGAAAGKAGAGGNGKIWIPGTK